MSHRRPPGHGPLGCEQLPEPLQAPADVIVFPVQPGGDPQATEVAAWAQVPAVAVPVVHDPVFPQTFVVAAQAASAPDVTAEQVPTLPVKLQAWQAPLQAELQHTPSAQLRPLPQEPPLAGQAWPAIQPVH